MRISLSLFSYCLRSSRQQNHACVLLQVVGRRAVFGGRIVLDAIVRNESLTNHVMSAIIIKGRTLFWSVMQNIQHTHKHFYFINRVSERVSPHSTCGKSDVTFALLCVFALAGNCSDLILCQSSIGQL